MSGFPLGDIAFKIISIKTFYYHMKMYGFPHKINESYAMNFFLLPIIGDDYKLIIDFPNTNDVIDFVNNFFKENGCYSPLFTYYSNIDPYYDKFMLFCEVYNITRITQWNAYIPLSVENTHLKMAKDLIDWGYANENAVKSPISCNKCFSYLLREGLAVFNRKTGLFYLDYKMLPDTTKELIDKSGLNKNKYLFTRELFLDTGIPDIIEK